VAASAAVTDAPSLLQVAQWRGAAAVGRLEGRGRQGLHRPLPILQSVLAKESGGQHQGPDVSFPVLSAQHRAADEQRTVGFRSHPA
jgi:hypothetical protein